MSTCLPDITKKHQLDRKKFWYFRHFIACLGALLAACNPGAPTLSQTASVTYSGNLTAVETDIILRLENRHRDIEAWVERCGLSVTKDGCSVGDATLFNGLVCLSGDRLSCEAVRRSQGADGRMWRSEQRIAVDTENSFSRDMAMGVLAYLVATRDRALARRWMNWIEKNDFRLCLESSDNRCEFTPGFWTLFREVWDYIGLPATEKMRSSFLDESVIALLQAHFSPAGYQLHLAGVNVLIRRRMGQRSSTLTSLADSLAERQPRNPFFAYLASGAEKNVVESTLSWCPASPPRTRSEWSFERDFLNEPWSRSMGWECVMLMNFLLKDFKENNGVQ